MGKMKDTAAAFISLISVEKGPQRRGLDSQAALTRWRMQISDAETGALHSERRIHIVRGTVLPMSIAPSRTVWRRSSPSRYRNSNKGE